LLPLKQPVQITSPNVQKAILLENNESQLFVANFPEKGILPLIDPLEEQQNTPQDHITCRQRSHYPTGRPGETQPIHQNRKPTTAHEF
jgi:hypothetical protein